MIEMTVSSISARLQAGEITSQSLVTEYISRIEGSPRRGVYVLLNAEVALAAARASDERRKNGKTLGVLDGIPYVLEDRFCTKGIPTENHSRMLAGYCPLYDAEVVRRLRAKGAILVGKLATDGFLAGYESSENNYEIAEVVAAGEIPFAVCSDVGGSAFQKVSATTVISRYAGQTDLKNGMIPTAPSFDGVCTVTRTVEDAKMLFDVLSGVAIAVTDAKKTRVSDLDVSRWPVKDIRKSYRILSAVETASEMAMYDGIRFGASAENQGSVEAKISKTRGEFFSYSEKQTLLLGTALLMDGRRESCYLPAREYRTAVQKDFAEALKRADVLRFPMSEQAALLPSYAGLPALARGGVILVTAAENARMLFEMEARGEGDA